MRQPPLFVTRWHGSYIASLPGAPCHLCGRTIRIGERVWYADDCLSDDRRTCVECKEESA